MTPGSADDLLEQLGRGEVEALGELFAAYAPYLRAVVRTQLSDRLRAKFDSVDVVQSVWVQVIRKLGRDGWRVNDEGHLRALLVTIARRRLAEEMVDRWRRGERPPAEEYLDRHPELRDDPAAALELIAEELALREEHGPPVSLAELADRFPQWQAQVRALAQCQQVLGPPA